MSVKSQVLDLLKSKEWVSVEDFERIFPSKTEGHLSWGQRMRSLREDGLVITKRKKANCPHTFEYKLLNNPPQFTVERGQLEFCK